MPRLALGRLQAIRSSSATAQALRFAPRVAAVPALSRSFHLSNSRQIGSATKAPPVAGGPVVGTDAMTGETIGGADIDVSSF